MIRTEAVSKHYGSNLVLDRVDLSVSKGSVYGLVGPNGAGKTTLLGILAGLRAQTSGAVQTNTNRVGVLPDTPAFDPWLTAREVVALALTLSSKSSDPERVDEMLIQAGLAADADRNNGGFSRGMLQRLGLAATLVADPELILLDEPASALDPLGRREVLDLIARLRGDATVVFSSHILSDVQEVCDTVGILRQGRLVFEGPLQRLLVGHATPRYSVRLRLPSSHVASALAENEWVTDVAVVDPEHLSVGAANLEALEVNLVPALTAAGARVVSISPEAPSLEDVFLEVVQ